MAKDVIIKNINKKTGTTYVYWGHSVFENGKTYSKNARTLIGKINVRGEFEPNKTFLLFPPEKQLETGLVEEPYYPFHEKEEISKDGYMEKNFGLVAVVEALAGELGVMKALKKVFPQHYLMILSLVEAMMCFPNRPLYKPKRFHDNYWHSSLEFPTEEKITGAIEAVTAANREHFFQEYDKARSRTDRGNLVCTLDTTSLSTYSTMLSMAKFGYNKEHDKDLKQINLLMVCDNETGVPLYYRNLDGNTADKKGIKTAVANMKNAELKKGTILVMDRGFYTLENMKLLLQSGFSFIACASSNGPYFLEAVEHTREKLEQTEYYIEDINRYCATYDISIKAPRRGRGDNSYPMTAYVFLDHNKRSDELPFLSKRFKEDLEKVKADNSLLQKDHFKKFFVAIKDEKGRITEIMHNTEAQKARLDRAGIIVCIGPREKDPSYIFNTYKMSDFVEKDYEAFKEKMRRPRHSIDEHLDGKVFLVFLQTIFEMAIKDKMYNSKFPHLQAQFLNLFENNSGNFVQNSFRSFSTVSA